MKICKKLYFGEMAEKQNKELLRNVKRKKWEFGIFVITLSETAHNLLDIYETIWFEQKCYKKQKMNIVGIAIGKEEAVLLVQRIIDDVYTKTGGFNVRDYFLTDKE